MKSEVESTDYGGSQTKHVPVSNMQVGLSTVNHMTNPDHPTILSLCSSLILHALSFLQPLSFILVDTQWIPFP